MSVRRVAPRRRRHAVDALDFEGFYRLATGYCMLERPFQTRPEVEAAWRLHRKIIMGPWLKFCAGTRPWAWWVVEAAPRWGERRVLTAAEVREWCERNQWPVSPTLTDEEQKKWAESARRDNGNGPMFVCHEHMFPPITESELAYLDRHGQISAEERATVIRNNGAKQPDGLMALWETHLAPIYQPKQ